MPGLRHSVERRPHGSRGGRLPGTHREREHQHGDEEEDVRGHDAKPTPGHTDEIGNGGELHQLAGGDSPVLTTRPRRAGPGRQQLAARRRPRPDPHGGPRLPREDLPLRPRAHPRARRPRPRLRRPRRLRVPRVARRPHPREHLRRGGQEDRDLRPLLDRRRQPRLLRPRPRRARLRDEVLHRRGQLGPRRQQHPRLLHPGRGEVPRPRPLGQGGARPRLPAGAVGARHLLGLRLAHARVHPHDAVADVGPRHPALVPDDGGLRRPHLPLRQRRRREHLREVPLEARPRHAVGRLERGRQDQRRRPRLPPPRPLRRHHAPATSRSGSSASRSSTTPSPTSSTSTSSTRPSSSPRSSSPSAPSAR